MYNSMFNMFQVFIPPMFRMQQYHMGMSDSGASNPREK